MKILSLIILGIIFIIGTFYYLTGYSSAFEADQACHYLLKTKYSTDNEYGCDHDLETRQWLLFQKYDNDNASDVLKRFRY